MTNAVAIAQQGSNNTTFRNRIINGACAIDQRNAGASGTASGGYPADRWSYYGSQNSKGTWQQNAGSVTPPAGFSNYIGFTSSSAYSPLSTDFFEFYQFIEGNNIADLGWGTANAKTITLSFWVRSSLTGTFGGFLGNYNSSRVYPYTYTVSAANTWEQKSVTVVGDTSGTWYTNNNAGVQVSFTLGAGSSYQGTGNAWNAGTAFSTAAQNNVVSTNGATFYITGIQFEAGSAASPFEYRSYTTELQLCQRYYEVINTSVSTVVQYGGFYGNPYASGTQAFGIGSFKVTKRSAPTVTLYDNNGTAGTVLQNGIAGGIAATVDGINVSGFNTVNRTSGSFTTSFGYPILAGFSASAEL